MPRFTNPYPQFTDSNGNPVLSGTLSFFESGTNTLKTVYADSEENTPIANPMTLAADGSAPNVFYSGAARVKLVDSNGVQIFDRDPVGGESQLGNFSTWGPGFLYGLNDIVKAANGRFYISIAPNNQDNNPTLDPNSNAFWEEIRFVGVYNADSTYFTGEVVQTNNGELWRSAVDDNTSNEPSVDSGANWLPAVDFTAIIATDAETQAGTIANKAVSPASLSSRTATEARTGLVELANNAEALAGNDNIRAMSPIRVHEAFKQFGLGVANVSFQTFSTAADWYKPAGFRCVVNSTSVGLPTGNFHYYQVISTTDAGTGYSALLVELNTNKAYFGNSANSATLPTFSEIYTTERPNVESLEIIVATTVTRKSPVTLLNRVSGSSFTTTLDDSTFSFADSVTLNKGQSSGTWTVSLSSGDFIYPNGASDNSLTIPSGFSYAISLHRRGDGNFEITVLG